MKHSIARLIVVAGLVAAGPVAYAHGAGGGNADHGMTTGGNGNIMHETHELQHKVNDLTKDIRHDDTKLTQDQQKLNALKIQQAESQVGKAAPLTPEQQRELQELQKRTNNLGQDVTRDTERLTADQTRLHGLEGAAQP